jgi:hypothetical protein
MPCKSCGSVNQSRFTGEIAIHFSGLKNIDKSVVWVFPELVVWIVAPRNLLCRKPNCANLEKTTPLQQGSLELSL